MTTTRQLFAAGALVLAGACSLAACSTQVTPEPSQSAGDQPAADSGSQSTTDQGVYFPEVLQPAPCVALDINYSARCDNADPRRGWAHISPGVDERCDGLTLLHMDGNVRTIVDNSPKCAPE